MSLFAGSIVYPSTRANERLIASSSGLSIEEVTHVKWHRQRLDGYVNFIEIATFCVPVK